MCCAPPLIGLMGVAGVGATVAAFAFAGVAFGLVVGAAGVVTALTRRRRANGHSHCGGRISDVVDVDGAATRQACEVTHLRERDVDNGRIDP